MDSIITRSLAVALLYLAPPALLYLAYHLYSTQSRSPTPVHDIKLPTVPDPTPLLEFDLATAKTRDHIYVNKTCERLISSQRRPRTRPALVPKFRG